MSDGGLRPAPAANRLRMHRTGPVPYPSDDLAVLRNALVWARGQGLPVKTLPRVDLIMDTSCALQELNHLHRLTKHDARTALQELVDSGIVRLFGPTYLDEEVRRKFAEFSEKQGIPTEWLAAAWETYRSRIRFFPTLPMAGITVRDAKDVAFLDAQQLIGAHAILTSDKDILDSSGQAITPDVVNRPLRTFARHKSVVLGIGAQATGGVVITGKIIEEVVKVVGRKPWLLLVGVAAGSVLLNRHNEQTAGKGRSFWHDLRDSALREIKSAFAAFEAASRAALASWQEVSSALGHQPEKTLVQCVLGSCIWRGGPMRENEIVRDLMLGGHPFADQGCLLRDVALVLRSDPRFRWTENGWTVSLASLGAATLPEPSSAGLRARRSKARPITTGSAPRSALARTKARKPRQSRGPAPRGNRRSATKAHVSTKPRRRGSK